MSKPERIGRQPLTHSRVAALQSRELGDGGFNRSLQHLSEGGCDDSAKAPITPFWTSATGVSGTAASLGAISTSAILVGDCAGHDQRGCCAGVGYVAACRNQDFPKGGRHVTGDIQIFD